MNRPDATEIYHNAMANGRMELNRPVVALAVSGFTSGLFMGLTAMGVAGMLALLPGNEYKLVALLLYPLGFIAVVVGRAQLFTENTLFPVLLVLYLRRHVLLTLRLWGVVFVANVLGTLAFALLVTQTGALRSPVVSEMVHLAKTATGLPTLQIFTSGIIGGWLIALMAWLVTAAQSTFGRVTVIWLLTFLVGVLQLAHCIASSGYILVATLRGDVSAMSYLAWLGLATAGNIVGGVFIVALLNYWQVHLGGDGTLRQKLSLAENENKFRRINEDIADQNKDYQPVRINEFVCECADLDCHQRVSLSDAEYRYLREKPTRFVILNSHRIPEIESIVKQRNGYTIVEKTGAPGEVAERGFGSTPLPRREASRGSARSRRSLLSSAPTVPYRGGRPKRR